MTTLIIKMDNKIDNKMNSQQNYQEIIINIFPNQEAFEDYESSNDEKINIENILRIDSIRKIKREKEKSRKKNIDLNLDFMYELNGN